MIYIFAKGNHPKKKSLGAVFRAFVERRISNLKQTERLTDRQADRQTCWQTGWQTDMLTDRHADRQTGWQTDRLTDRQADRQTCWQTDRLTDRQADWHKDWQTHKLSKLLYVTDFHVILRNRLDEEFQLGLERCITLSYLCFFSQFMSV